MIKMRPAERRKNIIEASVEEAEEVGYTRINRDAVAHRAGCAPSTVSHYFGDMETLMDEVMRTAVETHNLLIIAQGLAMRHPLTKDLPRETKSAAITQLAAV